MKSDLVDITVIKHAETDKAVCVSSDDEHDRIWLPKSQIEIEPTARSRIIIVTMPEWLAIEKELV